MKERGLSLDSQEWNKVETERPSAQERCHSIEPHSGPTACELKYSTLTK